jgi:hypothetical protein
MREIKAGVSRCTKYESEPWHYDIHELDAPQVMSSTALYTKITIPHYSLGIF